MAKILCIIGKTQIILRTKTKKCTFDFDMAYVNLKSILLILLLLLSSVGGWAGSYSITLYAIPSSSKIDFSSPYSLAWTALNNALSFDFYSRKHAMGHVFIELSGPGKSIFTGSTKDKLLRSGRGELLEGSGLGILFMGIDGRLEFDEELTRYLDIHYRRGSIAFIEASLSAENYERLLFYLDEYQSRGYDAIYNGFNKPREGLGAGCTAFGLSFLEVAGILPQNWVETWTYTVKVPQRLIGRPVTEKHVPVEKVFFSRRWANDGEESMDFVITDPYLIFEWIHEKWQASDRNGSHVLTVDGLPEGIAYTIVKRGNALGLSVDFSHFEAPREAVFLPPVKKLYNASLLYNQRADTPSHASTVE